MVRDRGVLTGCRSVLRHILSGKAKAGAWRARVSRGGRKVPKGHCIWSHSSGRALPGGAGRADGGARRAELGRTRSRCRMRSLWKFPRGGLTGFGASWHRRASTVSGREASGMKREHGVDDPKGTKSVAAPATVSGERG